MALEGERRERLVRTAAHEFAEVGFEQASLNAIITRCRMSKSSFYHVIDSKLALYDLVLTDVSVRLREELALPEPQVFAGDDYWSRVLDLIARLTEVLPSDSLYVDLGRILYDRRKPDGSMHAGRISASIEQRVHDMILVGRDCGAVRKDLPSSLQGALAFSMLRTLDEWSVHHHGEIQSEQVSDLVGAQMAALRRIFATDRA